MKRKIIYCIVMFIIILSFMFVHINGVFALTKLEERAADLNWDGVVDEKDLKLMLEIGSPEAPEDGIESPDGKYIIWEEKNQSSGSGTYAAGSGIYSQNEEEKKKQERIVEVAMNSDSYGIPHRSGYCLQWTCLVYETALDVITYGDCARCSGYYYGVSTDFSEIPVGAMVYGECGTQYGHVGIYVGDATVRNNSMGTLKDENLSSFARRIANSDWGWQGQEVIAGQKANPGLITKVH